jgi:hypothetical protein
MVITRSKKIGVLLALALLAAVSISGCGKFGATSLASTETSGPYLYVASGSTYAGNGVVPLAASNTIARYTLDGKFDSLVYDFNSQPGDQPAAMVDYDSESLLVLVENAGGGRRVDRIMKDGSSDSVFISSNTITGAIVRAIMSTDDGGWIVSRTGFLEKFSSARVRTAAGANPWVNAPAGACATSTTLIPSLAMGPGDNILFAHAAAGQNRIAMVKKTGYYVAADCLAGVNSPTVNHFPTAILYHPISARVFVGFGNTTGPVHEIYSYPATATTISAGTSAFNDLSVLAGISAMALLPDGSIGVASALSTMNTIEKFTVNSSTGVLTRSGTQFILPSVYTKSVSAMLVSN